MIFFLILGILHFFIKLIKCVIEFLVDVLKIDAKFLFYSLATSLIFIFSNDMTFKVACIALFFIIVATQAYSIIKEILYFQNGKKEDDHYQS